MSFPLWADVCASVEASWEQFSRLLKKVPGEIWQIGPIRSAMKAMSLSLYFSKAVPSQSSLFYSIELNFFTAHFFIYNSIEKSWIYCYEWTQGKKNHLSGAIYNHLTFTAHHCNPLPKWTLHSLTAKIYWSDSVKDCSLGLAPLFYCHTNVQHGKLESSWIDVWSWLLPPSLTVYSWAFSQL